MGPQSTAESVPMTKSIHHANQTIAFVDLQQSERSESVLEAIAAIEKRITTLEGISALPWGGSRVGVTVTVMSIALAIFLVACWFTLAFWKALYS